MNAAELLTREQFDTVIAERLAEDDSDLTGWFCISTDPWPCPASGCTVAQPFQTAAHRIVVWPRNDDTALLRVARDCRVAGRNPRVVEYQRSFGACIAWDVWQRLGCPVHGGAFASKPDGWDARPPLR